MTELLGSTELSDSDKQEVRALIEPLQAITEHKRSMTELDQGDDEPHASGK
jgi:hypothetical protein